MAGRGLEQVVRYLKRMTSAKQHGEQSDLELVQRFARTRDAAAFELLVWRHGEMVLKVCRRVTRGVQDAEDGFQATFLTLARNASSIGQRGSVAGWLYRVAFRSALEVKRRSVLAQAEGQTFVAFGPVDEAIGRELGEAVDEEIFRLPERYRSAIVLSCFQGKTNRQIAAQLRCPEATVRTWLARARERLRARLEQRGIQVSPMIVASALATPAGPGVSASLVSSAIGLVGGFEWEGAFAALSIARKVERLMFLQMLKSIGSVVLVMAAVSGIAAFSAHSIMAARCDDVQKPVEAKPTKEQASPTSDDRKMLIGTWERSVTSTRTITEPGKAPVAREVQSTVRWVITLDRIFWVGEDGFIDEEYAYKLDTTKEPRTIDLISRRYGTFPGIYRLEGDALWVSYGHRTGRPASFVNTPESPLPIFHRISHEPAKVTHHFPNDPGCFWMIAPTGPGALMATMGFTYLTDTDKDGAAVITIAHASSEKDKKREYRPVLFDKAEHRYLPQMQSGGSSGSPEGSLVSLQRWRMDPTVLPGAELTRIGIEVVTEESSWLAAKNALDRAKKTGLEVLPWPLVGNAYPLALTTIDGRKVGSEALEGKVVVLDCWASWCSPCLAKMPKLKRLYEKSHGDGLEIIGISLDNDLAKVEQICKAQGMTWPQVQAPTESQARETWRQTIGLESIPRILLIDRNGKLRADTPANLEEEIVKLLGEGKKK